jgi:TPR repeat protein
MSSILEVLIGSSVRIIIIAAAMALVLWGMRIKSPAIRHRAWTGVLHVMIFLPVLSLWVPRIPIPILPSTSTKQETQVHSLALSRSLSSGMIAGRESAGIRVSGDSESSTSDSTRKQSHTESRVLQLAIVVYFLGFCFFAVRLLTGMLLSYRLGRNALRNDGGYYYSRCTVPLTIGLFRTRILLPIDSKHWNPKKLEAVLAHESEHVQRHDSFVAWLALLNRCIYWFHPIAWWLCGKLNALAEQVCDERVLSGGHDCSAYAEYILEFARSIRQKSTLVPLGGSHFHGGKLALRIRRIMMSVQTPKISRGRLIAVAALCVFATLVPAVGKLARAIEAPPRLIPELSTAPDSLSQPNQMRAQEVPTEESNQPNAQQGTLPPDVEAENGDAEAQYNLGMMFLNGDYTEAAKWLRKAAEQGIAEAQFNLGVMYYKGQGIPQDYAEAEKWLRKAAEQGVVEAQYKLGDAYSTVHGIPQDLAKAMKWYRKAAEQGHAGAQTALGTRYQIGQTTPEELAEAMEWYRKAAKDGTAAATLELGEMSHNPDYAEAVKWYQKAAEQGYAGAQFNLGEMYDNGMGVPQDKAEAVKWYRNAADQGYNVAQMALGHYYEVEATPQDYITAYMWYDIAISNGFQWGAEMRENLARKMTPEDMKEAMGRVWRCKQSKMCDPLPESLQIYLKYMTKRNNDQPSSTPQGDTPPPIAIPEGMRAISVKVQNVIGSSGNVLPGARVDVIRTGPLPDSNERFVSRVILENIQVLSSGQGLEWNTDGRSQNVWVVTLLVTPEQAQNLMLAESDRIQLALRD